MSETKLEKSLSLWDAAAIVAGSMIGSGIFIVSADIARQLQSPLLLLITWVVAGIMAISAAICYCEFAASLPEAGGQYVFLKTAWGKKVGFLYGWTLFLVIQTGAIAAVCFAFGKFFGMLCPIVSSDIKLINTPHFSVSTLQVFSIGIAMLLTWINARGVKLGVTVQNLFTATKVIALLGIIICGGFFGINWETVHSNIAHVQFPQLHMNLYSAVAIALVGAFFSADSWNNVTFIASEIKDPEKNLPRALMIGVGGVILLYLLTNIVYLGVLPLEAIQNSAGDIVGATLIQAIAGDVGKVIISIIILISAFGCANGMIMAGARVYYAMAKDGLFFKSLTQINEKTHVPETSLFAQCAWVILLILSGSYSILLDFVSFATLLFYIFTISGLFLFRHKCPDIPRPYKTPFYPYLPIFYCLLAGYVSINLLIFKPLYTWAGLFIVLSGLPVYFVWQFINKKKAEALLERPVDLVEDQV